MEGSEGGIVNHLLSRADSFEGWNVRISKFGLAVAELLNFSLGLALVEIDHRSATFRSGIGR